MAEVVEPAGPRPPNAAPPPPEKPAHRGWPGVGLQLAERLAKIDVFSPADLILHLPLRYEDETRLTLLADARPGVPPSARSRCCPARSHRRPRRQLVARAPDASGEVMLRFVAFLPPSSRSSWPRAAGCASFGELRDGFFGAEMIHPRLKPVAAGEPLPESLDPRLPDHRRPRPVSAAQADRAARCVTTALRETLPEALRRN